MSGPRRRPRPSGRAKLEVNFIGVVNKLLREILAYQVGKLAADLIGQGQLAVRECARAGKAGGDGTGRLQFTQTPVLSLGQWRFSTGLPFSTSKILWGVLLLRSSSSAVKMRQGRRLR